MGFDSKHDFSPPTVLLGFIFCPWMWGVSSQSLQRLRAAAPAPHSHCTTPAQPPLQHHQPPLHPCTATTPASIILQGLLCPWMWGISSQSLQHHATTTASLQDISLSIIAINHSPIINLYLSIYLSIYLSVYLSIYLSYWFYFIVEPQLIQGKTQINSCQDTL